MQIHAISTGTVKITQNWRVGRGSGPLRLAHTLLDRHFTDWLPIYCYIVEHPEGLIVVDTGIPVTANAPIVFPPWMLLVQRAARFRISAEQEIGPQLRARGLAPTDVRWVILTHLHQDHDGGLQHFPQAEVIVARVEWQAAQGLRGRLGGYLNQRWPRWLAPTCIDFAPTHDRNFPRRYSLTQRGDVQLIPTPGHSAGHMAVLVDEGTQLICIAGDAAYTQDLLIAQTVDGVGPDPLAQQATHRALLQLAQDRPTVFLPSHEWDAERRLLAREPLFVAGRNDLQHATQSGDMAGA